MNAASCQTAFYYYKILQGKVMNGLCSTIIIYYGFVQNLFTVDSAMQIFHLQFNLFKALNLFVINIFRSRQQIVCSFEELIIKYGFKNIFEINFWKYFLYFSAINRIKDNEILIIFQFQRENREKTFKDHIYLSVNYTGEKVDF